MNADVYPQVRPRLIWYVLLALVVCAGCTPKHVSWNDTNAMVQPPPQPVQAEADALGYLVVAMRHLGQSGDAEQERFPPIYLYGQDGHFLRKLPDNTEHPTALTPGAYIVLIGETGPLGEFHQIQVQIDNGRTTSVSLADIDQAPEFWAMSRLFSK
jgi:hypothetical protein